MPLRRFTSLCAVLFLLFPLATSRLRAQSTATSSAQQRPTSTPYTGDLTIFESEGRDQRLHIDGVMKALAITPGKNVADIGAGSGWFTVRAARKVKTGTVYAVDINPESIKYIDNRVQKNKLLNVKTILGKPDNAELPPDSVDAGLAENRLHVVQLVLLGAIVDVLD